MKYILLLVLLSFFSIVSYAQDIGRDNSFLLAQYGAVNCGVKPVPRVGYKIGRCISGRWEQVSY
jgi:hypothetical protein